MKKTQFEPLVIHDYEEGTFHLPVHGHTYFEMAYIWKGRGAHLLNNIRQPYVSGDLFIISPEDQHYFEIDESTHFTFIKFTDEYFKGHRLRHSEAYSPMSPENVMRSQLLKEVKLVFPKPFDNILRNTMANIVSYNQSKDQEIGRSQLIYDQLSSLFGLIREAAAGLEVRIDNGQPDKEELISYIHQHVYDPHIIQVKNIASHFHISKTYFSAYFKRKFGVSYREYVRDYRASLIEQRILIPSLPINQIADEFGFTDESHFSNFFKSVRSVSPLAYRKAHLA